MARKIRFPLKMTNGTEVRTIEGLRANFDLTAVLGYYADGKLVTWLRDRYLDSEADKIEALDKDSKSFQSDLCAALGVEIPADLGEADGEYDEGFIKRRNEKRRLLGEITEDEQILCNVDSTAFNQDDLYEIYDNEKKEIYLCRGEFDIALSVKNVTYFGVADPVIKLRDGDKSDYEKNNIKFVNCGLDPEISPKENSGDLSNDFNDNIELKKLEENAELGNIKAQFLLAERYYNGTDGVEKDYLTACMWYTKAAEQGDPDAQNMLGLCYFHSRGVVQDRETAVKWFQKAAEQGSFRANNNLGNCYFNGNGVPQNYVKAFGHYLKAAETGYDIAQYNLGKCLLISSEAYSVAQRMKGGSSGKGNAEIWFTAAADQGYAPAMMKLAELYLGKSLGETNVFKAMEYLTKAAEKGNTEAWMKLAEIYIDGEHINRNEVKAVEFLTKAAEKNNVEAQLRLGEIYSKGFGKIAMDKNSAEKWYRKAAESGNKEAQNRLEKLKEKMS